MEHSEGLALALEEARISYEEGGIPVSDNARTTPHVNVMINRKGLDWRRSHLS